MTEPASTEVKLPAGGSKTMQFNLQPSSDAMGKDKSHCCSLTDGKPVKKAH